MEKKAWEKPELVILARSKPEESLLEICKLILSYGPLVSYDGCKAVLEDYCRIPPCKDLGTS